MKFYKNIENNYIVSVSTGAGSIEIAESECDTILNVIRSCPHAEGKGYRLRTDLTWEEYDLPPVEEEATEEDLLSALERLGVNIDEESEA